MPQMSPMNWINILLLSSIIIYIMFISFYFHTNKILKTSNYSNKTLHNIKYKNSW